MTIATSASHTAETQIINDVERPQLYQLWFCVSFESEREESMGVYYSAFDWPNMSTKSDKESALVVYWIPKVWCHHMISRYNHFAITVDSLEHSPFTQRHICEKKVEDLRSRNLYWNAKTLQSLVWMHCIKPMHQITESNKNFAVWSATIDGCMLLPTVKLLYQSRS